MPAAFVVLAEPEALLEVWVPEEPEESDVAVGLEPEREEPEEPDAPAPPDVLLPLEVLLLPLEPPMGEVELPPEVVPLERVEEG